MTIDLALMLVLLAAAVASLAIAEPNKAARLLLVGLTNTGTVAEDVTLASATSWLKSRAVRGQLFGADFSLAAATDWHGLRVISPAAFRGQFSLLCSA